MLVLVIRLKMFKEQLGDQARVSVFTHQTTYYFIGSGAHSISNTRVFLETLRMHAAKASDDFSENINFDYDFFPRL